MLTKRGDEGETAIKTLRILEGRGFSQAERRTIALLMAAAEARTGKARLSLEEFEADLRAAWGPK